MKLLLSSFLLCGASLATTIGKRQVGEFIYHAKDTTKECAHYAQPFRLETCETIITSEPDIVVSPREFYAWNPSVKVDCSGFHPGTGEWYCMGVNPSAKVAPPADVDNINFHLKPIPPPGKGFETSKGAPNDCTNWFASRGASGCAGIARTFQVQMTDFMAWNPSLDPSSDCKLKSGVAYCTGTPGKGSLLNYSLDSKDVLPYNGGSLSVDDILKSLGNKKGSGNKAVPTASTL
ncbi:hypothetical protein BT63DRAFT_429794 [Microthyrium microscopicum]|uniref:LysM domain-containing protein n=1 Tax=Microthyrium microscopicum TaxID=703497 RepID=A0A6A6U036_9PEZI|nr:hypothetical protein BT63DRAFT_429794 [Microthyrium microscopicum]